MGQSRTALLFAAEELRKDKAWAVLFLKGLQRKPQTKKTQEHSSKAGSMWAGFVKDVLCIPAESHYSIP